MPSLSEHPPDSASTAAPPATAGAVVRARFDLGRIPSHDRLAFWVDWLHRCIARADCDVADPTAMVGGLDHIAAAGAVSNRVRTPAQRVDYPRRLIAELPSEVHGLCWQRSGMSEVRTPGGTVQLCAGDVVLYRANQPIRFDLPVAGESHVVLLPAQRMREVLGGEADHGLVRLTARRPGAAPLFAAMQRFHDLPAGAAADRGEGALDTLVQAAAAALVANGEARRLAASSPDDRVRRLSRHHRQRVLDFIRANLRDPHLDVAMIAAGVGLSRSQLHRLHQAADQQVADIIWQERLTACARALEDPRWRRRDVGAIALAHGFRSPAHFSRLFKPQFGMPPRAWRIDRLDATSGQVAPPAST